MTKEEIIRSILGGTSVVYSQATLWLLRRKKREVVFPGGAFYFLAFIVWIATSAVLGGWLAESRISALLIGLAIPGGTSALLRTLKIAFDAPDDAGTLPPGTSEEVRWGVTDGRLHNFLDSIENSS